MTKEIEKQVNESYRQMAKQMRATANAIDANVDCHAALPEHPTQAQLDRCKGLNEAANNQINILMATFVTGLEKMDLFQRPNN
jgi:hypothetical protein